jgi:hypothetical protein
MDPDEIERVQKQLKEDFTVIGDGTDVVISIDSSEYVPDLDLFLWMYSKTGVPGGELAPDLSIDDIKTLTVTDAHDKRVQLYTSVDVDRAEAAVRARDPHSKFGPLRTLLGDGLNRLDVDWQLNLRGSFTIFVGTSRYEDAVGIAVKSRIGRLHAVTHVATSLIPRMYEAHRGDKTWHATGRAALRSQATANLVHTLAGSITCPNCGHVH